MYWAQPATLRSVKTAAVARASFFIRDPRLSHGRISAAQGLDGQRFAHPNLQEEKRHPSKRDNLNERIWFHRSSELLRLSRTSIADEMREEHMPRDTLTLISNQEISGRESGPKLPPFAIRWSRCVVMRGGLWLSVPRVADLMSGMGHKRT